ncbi:hypothetical protein KQI65_02515 [bacterium]|nr:hypothetical protein [bacterium]
MRIPRWKYTTVTKHRGMLFFILIPLLVSGVATAQEGTDAQHRLHSLSFFGGIVEDSQIFLSPQSPDPVERQANTDIGSTFGYGLSYRYRLFSTVALQLHGEYVHARSSYRDQVGTKIENGYDVWIAEVSGMFMLPFSSRRFEMFVGAGAGMYVGRRVYVIADVSSETASSLPAFGIHVLVGAEYLLTDHLGLRADIVFRDPQMSVENRFPLSTVQSNGVAYPLETSPFLSHVNLNGNVYAIGISWHF